jgi:hypothetical protein
VGLPAQDDGGSTQRAKGGLHLVDEQGGLFERSEVAAPRRLVPPVDVREPLLRQRRDGRRISRGNTEQPVGTVTGPISAAVASGSTSGAGPALSQ